MATKDITDENFESEVLKGDKLSKDNIWVKRPGTGDFKAEKYLTLIGEIAKNNIAYNTQLKKKDIK